MLKLLKNRKFTTNTKTRRCPIRRFSRKATHDYPIHEKDGAVLVSLNIPGGKARADKGGQHLPEIESPQKDQEEAQPKQKLSPRTICVIQAQSTLQDVEKGVNELNDASANDVDDDFLPKEKNQVLQTLDIPTYEKATASIELEMKKETDNQDIRTHETRVSRPLAAKQSVKKSIFSRKKRGEHQNGKKIAPLNQHQEEKRGKECWGDMHKDKSKTDNAVNKPVNNNTKGVSNKIPLWKRNTKNPFGKNVAHTEQKQGNKDDGHVFEGDSSLVKEGGEITATTTTPKLANVANVQDAKSMEVISSPNNGIHIYNNCQFHIHNHGLELYRNKTYTYFHEAPNGIINTGNSSSNTVNSNGMMNTGNSSNNSVNNNGMMNTGTSSNNTVNTNGLMNTGNSSNNTVNNNAMMNTGNSSNNTVNNNGRNASQPTRRQSF
ncbi:hypothetical protein ACJMK2_040281 [Sinanodonta woodiana]|uniref:Uncharacterized protein n=1 Tax=Sinanodonta woodiana TaxID=1069815 RepID=A0ABD3WG49_SINWO